MGHLFISFVLSFKPSNVPKIDLDHILSLYIVNMVYDFIVKRFMIDNGLALNLSTLMFIKQEGYTKEDITNEVITIKAYINLKELKKGK